TRPSCALCRADAGDRALLPSRGCLRAAVDPRRAVDCAARGDGERPGGDCDAVIRLDGHGDRAGRERVARREGRSPRVRGGAVPAAARSRGGGPARARGASGRRRTGFRGGDGPHRAPRPRGGDVPMTPRLPDIVCVSSIDWDFIWQGHQEIMSRLAAAGHRVLFVENTGVRTPQMRDLPRVRRRIENWWRGTNGFREERPNLFVYSPLVLPWPYLRPSRWINRLALGRAIRRWMRAAGFSQPVVWTVLPAPLAPE